MDSKISFSWDIHWKCNYRCPYCWWHDKWDEFEKRNIYPSLDELIVTWKRIYDLYGQCHIEIVGGEPSIYPNFSEFILEILNYHTVSIMTNLSGNIDKIINDNSAKVRDRFRVNASLHPLFVDIDEFFKKVKKISENHIRVGVLYLAYPPQIQDIAKYKKMFVGNKIYFSVSTFWGTYNGKKYPDSYTDEEKQIIGLSIATRNKEKFQTEPLATKGKLCNAGHKYALIHPDGEVLPCGGAGWEGKQIILGNIFEPNFRLLNNPKECPSQNCPCNEWSFLLVDKDFNKK